MSAQAQSVAMPTRFPLVQQLYTRSPSTPITQDARLINAYAELDPQDKEYWIFKRVGISPAPLANSHIGFAGGTYYYQPIPTVLSVVGGTIYSGGFAVGTLQTGLNCFFETVNSSPQTIVIMNPNGAGIYTPSTSSFVRITDANYPTQACPGWAYLDGTLYVMDYSGNIWGTAGFNNAAVWDGLNVIQASSKADQGVFLATQLSYVIAFKQWTTQIFYDAGNPTGSPLAPVPDAQIPYGCLHPYTVQKVDEILFWVTSNQAIAPQVVMMQNLSPQIISTASVERLLAHTQIQMGEPQLQDQSFFTFVLKFVGHIFYGITSTVQNFTIVYDVKSGIWSQWTDSSGNCYAMANFTYTQPTYTRIPPFEPVYVPGQQLAQCITPTPSGNIGNIYTVDDATVYPNDFGQLFAVDVYTPNFSAGTDRRKTLNMMYFSADQTAGSILQARYSDDDYKHWTNFRSIELNVERPYLDQEGTFTRRAYHLRHRCNTRFRIKSSGLQMDIGTL